MTNKPFFEHVLEGQALGWIFVTHYISHFQTFSSHGPHKLPKFCGTPPNIIFADLTKKK